MYLASRIPAYTVGTSSSSSQRKPTRMLHRCSSPSWRLAFITFPPLTMAPFPRLIHPATALTPTRTAVVATHISVQLLLMHCTGQVFLP